jgi:beta-N-acetylhexosaminidase
MKSHRHLLLGVAAAATLVVESAPAQPRPSARVRAVVAGLSVRQQVGQLVMPWLLGDYAGFDADGLQRARGWIDSLEVGGIVISIGSPLDVASKLNFLQRRSKLPLLIASDLEGGASFRFVGATPFPTNMGVAATGREPDAYTMGRITGFEGRAVGVHLTFSPVADVNNNPGNPVINTRSFGSDPVGVGRLVAANIRGLKTAGMLASAKHFPGHGDTDTDSHISLPVVGKTWTELAAVELVPFRAAIAAGVDVIMSAHIALPALDRDSIPATLSKNVMGAVLRDSLGFKGLVVTDALDMGALVTKYGSGEAAVLAFEAGSDLLLMPADPRAAIEAMVQAVRSGRITRQRLATSVSRLVAMKEAAGLFQRRTVSLDRIGRVVGRQAFLDSARAITSRSLVLVRDQGNAVDRLRREPGPLAVVTYGDASAGAGFPGYLAERGHRVSAFRLSPTSGPASYDSARTLLSQAPIGLFSVAVRVTTGSGSIAMPAALAGLIAERSRAGPTVVVSFGSPYLLNQVPTIPSLLLAWTSNPLTERAAARALSGDPIGGRLPIALPPFAALGDGIALPGADASGR